MYAFFYLFVIMWLRGFLMGKVIAICGKICSGKTYYANQIKEKENAVILSCDELTKILFDNNLGEKHDEMSKRIWDYLLNKAVEIVKAKTSVILDWGFWSKADRVFISEFFKSRNIVCEFHYVDANEKAWKQNIDERNKKVQEGLNVSDYYLDEGLMQKLLLSWEEPTKEEIDVWHHVKR